VGLWDFIRSDCGTTGAKNMRKISKLSAILAIALIASVAVSAAYIYQVNQNATVTIVSPQYSVFAIDCSTPISTLSFGSMVVSGTQTVQVCLKNTGSAPLWLRSNSVTSTLPASVGTLSYVFLNGGGQPAPYPIGPSNYGWTIPLNLTLTASATAPAGAAPFVITITGYSTGS